MSEEKIGRYEVLRPLGKGAMGIVYLARDPQIERIIALKTIQFDSSGQGFDHAEAKARFLREAKISGRLQHPNIVTIYDVGEHAGNLFLAMEYVAGGSLADKLPEAGSPLDVYGRIRVVAEVADALAHAHERGVIHRDVKPANILLTESLVAKVTDFGIGKIVYGDTELTAAGQMVGSPAYMSPEQIRGEKVDARSDIFSLGVVLYQALTQKRPFPSDTLTTLVYQILNDEPQDPCKLRKDIPPEISPVLKKMLAKKRDQRYQDAALVAEDLRAAAGISQTAGTGGLNESRIRRQRMVATDGDQETIQVVFKAPSGSQPLELVQAPQPPVAVSHPKPLPPQRREPDPVAPQPPAPPPARVEPVPSAPPRRPPSQVSKSAPRPVVAPPPPEPDPEPEPEGETQKERLIRVAVLVLSFVILAAAAIFAITEMRRSAEKAIPVPTPTPVVLPTFPVAVVPTPVSLTIPTPAPVPGDSPVVPVTTPVP